MITNMFNYKFSVGSALDIGIMRKSNQDRVILCPEIGFFAVSDGMGGLAKGGETSEVIAEVLPGVVEEIAETFRDEKMTPARIGAALGERVRLVSDNIYDAVNTNGVGFGATLSCVWLIQNKAIYVNLGDSRGHLLPRYRRTLIQVTDDHNVAGVLVRLGEMTKEESRHHPSSSRLTQFMGMPAPAHPDVFIETVHPGDRILLCSDGLHGELDDREIRKIMRSSKSSSVIASRLAEAANMAGGSDNISAVFIKIEGRRKAA